MDLAIPLFQSQIMAASNLRGRMHWLAIDRALYALSGQFPGFDLEVALLKVAAINQLYGTNVFATVRMAQHIVSVMAYSDDLPMGVDLVEQIASLPEVENQRPKWSFYSFASKFAHFFVSPEAFPMYDTYVTRMVKYHLGPQTEIPDAKKPYRAFFHNIEKLREAANLTCTTDELDRYLWLAGLFFRWFRDRNAKINVEVKNLFESPSPQAAADLVALLPSGAPRPSHWEL